MKWYIILLFIFQVTHSMGQLHDILSLPDDTAKVISLLDLGYSYEASNPDSAILIYEKAGNISRSIDYHLGLGRSLNYRGIVAFETGDYSASEDYYLESVEVFRKIGYMRGIAAAFNNIGNIYLSMGIIEKSIEYNLKGLAILEETGDTLAIIDALNNLGTILFDNRQYTKSEHYYQEALQLASRADRTPGRADLYLNLANTYERMGDSLRFESYLKRALSLIEPGRDPYNASLVYTGYSNFLSARGEQNEALEYALLALKLAKQTGNPYTYCKALVFAGEKYQERQIADQARYYYDRALEIALPNNYTEILAWLRYNRAMLEADNTNFRAAYHEMMALNSVKDSLFHADRQRMIQEMESRYQTARKESRIAEQELTIARQEFKVNRQRSLIFWILITVSGVVFTLILGVAYIQQRRNTLKNQVITLKKERELTHLKYLIEGEEKERSRLAKELHDGVNGSLGAIKILASGEASGKSIDQPKKWEKISQMIDEVSHEVREISHNLMPDNIRRLGLKAGLEDHLAKINRAGDLEIDLQTYGEIEDIEEEVKVMLYRIVQELLRNIINHANASRCIVQLNRHEHEISLVVEDNGIGFDVFGHSMKSGKHGIGLQSIYSRIELLGGKIDIQSTLNTGTSVHINIPQTSRKT